MSDAEQTGEARQDKGARLLAGRYRLADVLGRGGMGTVWRALDEMLGRTVAVKELRFPSSIDEEEKRRLITRTLREAKAIARIRNTSAVTVYDVVDEDDRPWIVMELVEGKSLAEVIREDGVLTPRRAAEVGLAVLDVLRSAHRQGILHRDVKPSNVLIAEDGRVVLTDFGIAQVEGDPSITSTGMLVGAPSYISPERARGHRPGPAADLWSLGGLLYASVEGVPPYDKGSAIATLTAVMTEPLEPPKNAGPLEKVIYGLLAKDPDLRLDDAGARVQLSEVVRAPESAQAPEPRDATTRSLPLPSEPADAPPADPRPVDPRSADPRAAVATPADAPSGSPSGSPSVGAAGGTRSEEAGDRLRGALRSVRKAAAAATAGAAAGSRAGKSAPAVPVSGATADRADVVADAPAGPPSDSGSGQHVKSAADSGAGQGSGATTDCGPGRDDGSNAGGGTTADVTAAGSAKGAAAGWSGENGGEGASESSGESATDGDGEKAAGATVSGSAAAAPATASASVGAPLAGPYAATGAPAVPGQPPGARSGPAFMKNVSRRTLVIVAVVVALAVLGTVLALTLRGRDSGGGGDRDKRDGTTASGGAAAGGGKGEGDETGGTDADENDGTGKDPEADGHGASGGSGDPDDNGSDGAPGQGTEPGRDTGGPGADPRPGAAGVYKSAQGFSIGLPRGWKHTTNDAAGERFTGPDGQKLLIGWTTSPKDDPVADWRNQEKYMRRSQYHRVGIRPVDYRGWLAADWEFTYTESGTKYRTVDRGFVVNSKLGYGMMYTAKADKWDGSQRRDTWNTFTQTFEPKP